MERQEEIVQEYPIKTVDVNGTQLHYIERGGENNKQSVVFTHGTLLDYRQWEFQVEPFSRNYRVICYSRRHAYPNKVEEDFRYTEDNDSMAQYASDLAELIKKLKLSPAPHLIGHSDGGFATLYCAYKNPELVKSLVLCEPAAFPLLATSPVEEDRKLSQDFWENAVIPARETIRNGESENGLRIFVDEVMMEGFFDKLPAPVKQMILDNAKAFLKQKENPMPRYSMPKEINLQDLEQKLSSVPTLFVKGESSPKFLHRIIDILDPHLQKSKQVTIPGVT
jgi:non-heme chloroperoxidase